MFVCESRFVCVCLNESLFVSSVCESVCMWVLAFLIL